ncbi:MAG: hypothetical protein E6J59_00630 [Deltaproteobacteria bacterium]|nr:MAG: hypothetical protein E6J59_00630 [Deltaproteobacteria bacterium]
MARRGRLRRRLPPRSPAGGRGCHRGLAAGHRRGCCGPPPQPHSRRAAGGPGARGARYPGAGREGRRIARPGRAGRSPGGEGAAAVDLRSHCARSRNAGQAG